MPRGRRTGDRALRRRVRDELRALDLTSPLDASDLCARLAEHRGRPLSLLPAPLPVPGPFGVWVATSTADTIVYQSATSAAHQRLIILHEVGHIVAGHGSGTEPSAYPWPPLSDGDLDRLFPHLSPETVRRALGRENYDDVHEREAELVGSIVFEWADRLAAAGHRSATTELGRRTQDALEDHAGWV